MIEIPAGVELAKKTFNPRLGIEGGISVLGTSGIVIPMSEAALVASLRLEMKMLVEGGGSYLVITPGNYGQAFSKEQTQLNLTYSMKCSNYVGETLDMARELGVKRNPVYRPYRKVRKSGRRHHEHPFPPGRQPK